MLVKSTDDDDCVSLLTPLCGSWRDDKVKTMRKYHFSKGDNERIA